MATYEAFIPTFHDWTRHKKTWGQAHRLVFDKHPPNGVSGYQIAHWVEENCSGRFSHSTGYEVFIFEHLPDAVLTKLRWNDAVKGLEGEAA